MIVTSVTFQKISSNHFLSPNSPLIFTASKAAEVILNEYKQAGAEFREITEGAQKRFEQRNWQEGILKAKQRVRLYEKTLKRLKGLLLKGGGDRLNSEAFWKEIKSVILERYSSEYDLDLALTFFYAIRKMVFEEKNTDFDFVDEAYLVPRKKAPESVYFEYFKKKDLSTLDLLKEAFKKYSFKISYRDLDLDLEKVSQRVEVYLSEKTGSSYYEKIEFLKPLFYRNKGAYIVARVQSGGIENIPLIFHLENIEGEVAITALVMESHEARNIFGYSVSSFYMHYPWHREVVDFLSSLMGGSIERTTMYQAIGYFQHAKSVLYKEMTEFISKTPHKFKISVGEEGTVMLVFDVKGYRYVFKVIKDPDVIEKKKKGVFIDKVIEQYRRVVLLDRAGRLLTSMEFENLKFKTEHFSEEVLTALREMTSESIEEGENREFIRLKRVFVQRKTIPLDVFVKTGHPVAVRKALIDFGYLLKDLGAANIFVNDILLKNFGVTSSGKVVVYDFDDLKDLLDVKFELTPEEKYGTDFNEDEVNAGIDKWGFDPYIFMGMEDSGGDPTGMFAIDETAVYPGQDFFFNIYYQHRKAWDLLHGDLRQVKFWNSLKGKINKGFVLRFYPFPKDRLLNAQETMVSDRLTTLEFEPPRSMEQEKLEQYVSLFLAAYEAYIAEFSEIIFRAKKSFEKKDWQGIKEATLRRIHLLKNETEKLEKNIKLKTLLSFYQWKEIRKVYLERVSERYDHDHAMAFIDYVLQRIEGFQNNFETKYPELSDDKRFFQSDSIVAVYSDKEITVALLEKVLSQVEAEIPGAANLEDLEEVVLRVNSFLKKLFVTTEIDRVEVLQSLFIRNKSAYIVSRIVRKGIKVPMVFPIVVKGGEFKIDAVLMDRNEVRNLFGFTRSGFLINAFKYREVIQFLHSILPAKETAALFSAIGLEALAEAHMLQELKEHINQKRVKFKKTVGTQGSVMSVFTLPDFGYVFKVIRTQKNRLSHQLQASTEDIIRKYEAVKRMDRVGRILNTMKFENIRFKKSDFLPEVLEELLKTSSKEVWLEGDEVVIRQMYVQRKVIPIDHFMKHETSLTKIKEVALDFGRCVKELAAANIFIVDSEDKNFGVMETGRVVCYDFDSMTEVTDGEFRSLSDPHPFANRYWESEDGDYGYSDMDDPSFYPQDLEGAMGVPVAFQKTMRRHHGELYTPEFWNDLKEALKRGDEPELYPYLPKRRLNWRETAVVDRAL